MPASPGIPYSGRPGHRRSPRRRRPRRRPSSESPSLRSTAVTCTVWWDGRATCDLIVPPLRATDCKGGTETSSGRRSAESTFGAGRIGTRERPPRIRPVFTYRNSERWMLTRHGMTSAGVSASSQRVSRRVAQWCNRSACFLIGGPTVTHRSKSPVFADAMRGDGDLDHA